MNRDERIELKPCPFCGGVAKQGRQREIYCTNCGVTCWGNAEPADQEWNTRDREAVLVAALEATMEFIKTHQHPWDSQEYQLGVDAYNVAAKALKEYRGER